MGEMYFKNLKWLIAAKIKFENSQYMTSPVFTGNIITIIHL